jgi:predicted dehydrogenase
MSWSPDRRTFLAASAAVGSAAFLGAAPAKKEERRIAVGCIGVANRGETNCVLMVGQDVRALCDVDQKHLNGMSERFPAAKPFADWREMLDKVELEAVLISTPDHHHAPLALAAMKKGLHVYIEKPVAHTIEEVRKIEALAKEKNVVAWMGNQHHVSAGYRRAIEYLEAGTVGPIKEIHAWTSRPTWIQGVKRPSEGSPVPPDLSWDLWLGPAPERAYNPIYHPVQWRGWWDFGGGTLADFGSHLLDPVFSGLKLQAPTSVSATVSETGNDDTAPEWSIVKFEFPATGAQPACTLTWYDGGNRPAPEMMPNVRMPMNGVLCVGEKGKLFIPDLGRPPRVFSNMRGEVLPEPEQKVALTRGHQQDWLAACREGKPNQALFSEACRLTELCQVGNIAIRMKKPLKWDAARGTFDLPEANQLLRRTYRKGWELPS